MAEIKNAPQPTIERISSLINRIQSGDIKIPQFQRGFIWKEHQVKTLLDSIYEGYPISSLLFWLTDERMKSERNIGGFDLPPTPEKYPRNYVLDGQQRLTSIYGVLNWQDPKKEHIFNVYYDLKTKKFYHYKLEENNFRSIPLGILFDTKKFLDFQKSIFDFEDYKELNNELIVLYMNFG